MKKKVLKYEWILNVFLLMSICCITSVSTLQVNKCAIDIFNIKNCTILSVFISGVISSVLLWKFHIVTKLINKGKVFGKKIDYLLAVYLSINTSHTIIKYFSNGESYIKNVIIEISNNFNIYFDTLWKFTLTLLSIILLPAIIYIYLFLIKKTIPKIINFFKNLSKIEKKYIIISSIIMFGIITYVTINTSVFHVAIDNKHQIQPYDVLFNTDAGTQVITNTFQNFGAPENDLRQPLFALFSFPFGLLASNISDLFPFVPNRITYSYFLSILQSIVLIICSILISRMINKKSNLYSLIGYTLMFSTIFFSLNIEQYVFGIFWLILLIYLYVVHNKSNSLIFSAASGSLITNVVLLPIVVPQKNIKEFLKNCINYSLIFLSVILIFGQSFNIINNLLNFDHYTAAMGATVNMDFYDRLLQFISFISNCFIAPHGQIDFTRYWFVSYQLKQVTAINIVGMVLLIVMIISFILNFKKKIAKISFGWLIFSFIILCVLGWGTIENSLIIYGVYFSWAYFILIYLFIDKIFAKFPKVKFVIFLILFIFMFINNLFLEGSILDIIKFGKEYYPFVLQ